MCFRSKEAPEYPLLPQEPAKFPKGARQQSRCPQDRPCISSVNCRPYGVCQTIPGSGKYVLISKVWFSFDFNIENNSLPPIPIITF